MALSNTSKHTLIVKIIGADLTGLPEKLAKETPVEQSTNRQPSGRQVAQNIGSVSLGPLLAKMLDDGFTVVDTYRCRTSTGNDAINVVLTDDAADTRRVAPETQVSILNQASRVRVVAVWENPGNLSVICAVEKVNVGSVPVKHLAAATVYPRRIAFSVVDNPEYRTAMADKKAATEARKAAARAAAEADAAGFTPTLADATK